MTSLWAARGGDGCGTGGDGRSDEYAWWGSLKHGGLFMSPSRIPDYFPANMSPLPAQVEEALRRELTRFWVDPREQMGSLLDTVLELVVGLGMSRSDGVGRWVKGNQVPAEWARKAITGETIKPDRLWEGLQGGVLPVFVEHPRRGAYVGSRLGMGRGRHSASRVVEWLREADKKLGLVTNGAQWRLIFAGPDYDAFVEWDTSLWFEGGRTSLQVTALRILLGPMSLTPSEDGQARLLAAIEASRRGQAELSAALGERVRQAIEILIDEVAPVLTSLNGAASVKPRDIYLAATRVVMRLVIILFAEARDLLPRDNLVYHESYSLGGLREALERASAGGSDLERLRHRCSAWPRVIALFRLVYQGSPHEALPIPRYGGSLFEPGDARSDDPVSVALGLMEDTARCPSDAAVAMMLERLCRCPVRVRQGRGFTRVNAPVDFSDLSSEYVGIVYEGLLDYEPHVAQEGEPVVFLRLGDQPALPLSRLEQLDDAAVQRLVAKFKNRTVRTQPVEDSNDGGDAGSGDDEENADEESGTEERADAEPVEVELDEVSTDPGQVDARETLPDDGAPGATGGYTDVQTGTDVRKAAADRAVAWATRAVRAGGLVARPRSKSSAAIQGYEARCTDAARQLVARVVLPGEWFLVRWGGTRKGAGTFYTRPQLAVPTVHRTLRPLAYAPRAGRDAESPDEDAPFQEWTPRAPEDILSLKVCDPACGSGSFLVAALRFLTGALMESLHAHGRIRAQHDRALVTLADGRPEAGLLSEELLPCPPDSPGFEPRLSARLKRHVVERCIYGVDLDPLAVELARLSLWIETMDRELPFGFLDHKLKVGNSLVGCWFDRFRDYPLTAWEREGGDANHANGVHFRSGQWTRALRRVRKERIKPEFDAWLATQGGQPTLPLPGLGGTPEWVLEQAAALLDRIHRQPLYETEERAAAYHEGLGRGSALERLRGAFDAWCAVWFWPPDQGDSAPGPLGFPDVPDETRTVVQTLTREFRFFHWELEFPDVFAGPDSGFDAVVGNPPWDIQKPNSKEFFSNIDPLYRTYGKQEALSQQRACFERAPGDEEEWLRYCARFKALSNWVKRAAFPQGDAGHKSGRRALAAEQDGSPGGPGDQRSAAGYADPEHPFRHQGSADINTYKMFLEQSYALLRRGGRLGLIVPSGVYTDKGATNLRRLFLDQGRWIWVFGFENKDRIFDIHRSYKFCPVVIEKGGSTDRIRTAFMRGNLRDWENAESLTIGYSREQIQRFSPYSFSILEIQHKRDLEVLEKIYSNSVLLGDRSSGSWQVQYATEFHMTNDSQLFRPRPQWEEEGYRPDEYGRWLRGRWCDGHPQGERWELGPGVILARDGGSWIHETDVEDVALPLYEGRMIGQFDFSCKGWVHGKGRGAVWRDIDFGRKVVDPEYLVATTILAAVCGRHPGSYGLRLAFMDVTSATNRRSMLSTVLHDVACGNTVPILESVAGAEQVLCLVVVLNSFVYDYSLRTRLGGTHLNWFIIAETPLPSVALLDWPSQIRLWGASLCWPSILFAPFWLRLRHDLGSHYADVQWQRTWSVSRHERLRVVCLLDAIAAEAYGLEEDDLRWILRSCDQPIASLRIRSLTRTFGSKGFWRVDKSADPELRQTVLTLAAFHDLKQAVKSCGDQQKGIEVFCRLNGGEGWMIPETLCLADLGLGHDDRARRPQPVRERLGDRFLPWQLELAPEESWRECELHARNILGEVGFNELMRDLQAGGRYVYPESVAGARDGRVAAEHRDRYGEGGRANGCSDPPAIRSLFGDTRAGESDRRNK